MPVPHEEAARKIHPDAEEFRPLKRTMTRLLYGWVFQTTKKNTSIPGWSWVTGDLEVSEDITSRPIAENNLRAYVKHRPSGHRSITVGGSMNGNTLGTNSVVSTGDNLTFKKAEES